MARSEATAGTIEFTVRNTGSKVDEFHLYGEGDQIIGEVENITPGLTRSFHVEVASPGTYQTAGKPGTKGSGIRADFRVTGATTSQAPDAHKRFVPMQRALAAKDGLNEYIEHTGSAVFACPPGLGPDENWGQDLFSRPAAEASDVAGPSARARWRYHW